MMRPSAPNHYHSLCFYSEPRGSAVIAVTGRYEEQQRYFVTANRDRRHSAAGGILVTMGYRNRRGELSMLKDPQSTIDALKFQLEFLERGGYDRPVCKWRKELSIFQDSPSCPNYFSPMKTIPCSDCFLIELVPSDKSSEAVPCHHIPLNQQGDTIASLESDNSKLQQAVRSWLQKTIDELQRAPRTTESTISIL